MIKIKYYLSHLLLVWGSWHVNISSNLKILIQIHILTLSKWVLPKSKSYFKKKKMEREKREYGKFEIPAILWWVILKLVWYSCLNNNSHYLNTITCIFTTLFNLYIFSQHLNNIIKYFLIVVDGAHTWVLPIFLKSFYFGGSK